MQLFITGVGDADDMGELAVLFDLNVGSPVGGGVVVGVVLSAVAVPIV